MTDNLEYIEQYFMGRLNTAEKETFENRCAEDAEFAREVGMYISMRAALRQTLVEERKEEFRKLYKNKSATPLHV